MILVIKYVLWRRYPNVPMEPDFIRCKSKEQFFQRLHPAVARAVKEINRLHRKQVKESPQDMALEDPPGMPITIGVCGAELPVEAFVSYGDNCVCGALEKCDWRFPYVYTLEEWMEEQTKRSSDASRYEE